VRVFNFLAQAHSNNNTGRCRESNPSNGNRCFLPLRCAIEVGYIFASVKTITVNFLFWENTTCKELHRALARLLIRALARLLIQVFNVPESPQCTGVQKTASVSNEPNGYILQAFGKLGSSELYPKASQQFDDGGNRGFHDRPVRPKSCCSS